MHSYNRWRRGALSNVVWTLVGIAIAIVLAAAIYLFTTRGLATSTQLTVKGIQITLSNIIVEIRNIGMSNVRIVNIRLLKPDGSLASCSLVSVRQNGVTTSLPTVLRPGDVLLANFTGIDCRDVVVVLVETDTGVYKGVVSG